MSLIETGIDQVLKNDIYTSECFLGVFARDELPIQPAYPSCLVFNTMPRSNSGEHWLALYYNENGECDFFDSYANSAETYRLTTYLDRTSNSWKGNTKRIQGLSQYCGYYVILFLILRVRSRTLKFFQYFDGNLAKNDKKIKALIDEF